MPNMNLIRIKDNKTLYRDPKSMALVSEPNSSEYNEYLRKRKLKLESIRKEQIREDELNNLRTEVSEIKQMLVELLKKTNG